MSIIDRFINAVDQIPRDEPLGRIRVVSQGQELPERTIKRLHSDRALSNQDKARLRKWAEAHGYDPDLLAEEKRLRMVEDCEHLNHRPISEHWQVECSDETVSVPDTVGNWQRAPSSDYRVPVQWLNNGTAVQIQGMYGRWTVTADGSTLTADVSASTAVQAARDHMDTQTAVTDFQDAAQAVEDTASEPLDMDAVRKMAQNCGEPDNPPDWFDVFPRQIGDYERCESQDWNGTPRLTYSKKVPGERLPTDRVRIKPEDGLFVFRQQIKAKGRKRWRDTSKSVVFRKADAETAATALEQVLNPAEDRVWPPEEMFQEDEP